jgi:cytochrome oxidase assembly protein ShyY1
MDPNRGSSGSSIWRSLRWWTAHLLVLTLCVAFIELGFWQIRRLEERRLENQVLTARFSADPLPLDQLLEGAGSDLDSLHFRWTTVSGVFQPEDEVLVRSQVHNGQAGFHLITPLLTEDGIAILVNRGWVPLELDMVPSPVAPPPGEVTVKGWLSSSQSSRSASAEKGRVVSSVDIPRLEALMPWPLLPLYLIADGNRNDAELPVPVSPPDLTDQGPHLVYAIQWFAFALIGATGYVMLIRRARRPRAPTARAE